MGSVFIKDLVRPIVRPLKTFLFHPLLPENPETREIATLLKVKTVYGENGPLQSRRIGRDFDGGYVVPDIAIDKADAIFGYGISDDISFEEAASSLFGELYYDPYTEKHPEFDDSTFTCTNLFTARTNGRPDPIKISERHEIDDYVLIRKPQKEHFKNLEVTLLKDTCDVSQDPSEVITDHRAYLAQYEIDSE